MTDMQTGGVAGQGGAEVMQEALVQLNSEVELLRSLTEVTRLVTEPDPLQGTLARLVEVAGRTLDGCEVGVLVAGDPPRRTLESAGSSARRAARLDETERRTGEGPCVEALAAQRTFHLPADEFVSRWPTFGPVAAETGAVEILAEPFLVQGECRGALNVYVFRPGALDERARRLATLLAEQAAIALANAQLFARSAELAHNLSVALETRGVIEQAKGMIMARRRCDEDAAFEVLRRASQESNVKVRDLSRQVVDHATGAGTLEVPAGEVARRLLEEEPAAD